MKVLHKGKYNKEVAMAKAKVITKEARKKIKLDELLAIFNTIPENKEKLVNKLIDSAAFMAVELEELEKFISENGVTEHYQNGSNQFGVKVSSEVQVYNNLIKNYSNIIKQLLAELPSDPKDNAVGKALIDFALGKK